MACTTVRVAAVWAGIGIFSAVLLVEPPAALAAGCLTESLIASGVPGCEDEAAFLCPAGDAGMLTVRIRVDCPAGPAQAVLRWEDFGGAVPCGLADVRFLPGAATTDVEFTTYGGFGITFWLLEPTEGCPCLDFLFFQVKSPDMDGDLAVTAGDFGRFAAEWLSTDPASPADFDCNSQVSSGDFGLFASHWLHTCE